MDNKLLLVMTLEFIMVVSSAVLPRNNHNSCFWSPDKRFYVTSRRYTQMDARSTCQDRDDLQLVRIEDEIKLLEITEFLSSHEIRAAWTDGVVGGLLYNEYFWGTGASRQTANFLNWAENPNSDNTSKNDWYESGIVVENNPMGKFRLESQGERFFGLCEKK